MNKDILEIFLDQFSLDFTGYGERSVSVICIVNWHFPRENIRVLSSVIPFDSVRASFVKTFSSAATADYSQRILFKEERLGNSYFSCEVHRIDDPGVFGEMLNKLVKFVIKGVENPFVGSGLDILLEQLSIDKSKMLKLAAGKVELDAQTVNGLLAIPLRVDKTLSATPKVDDFGDVVGDDHPQIVAGTANGELRLRLNRLN